MQLTAKCSRYLTMYILIQSEGDSTNVGEIILKEKVPLCYLSLAICVANTIAISGFQMDNIYQGFT